MEPTLVATACMSMKRSRDPITTGTAASVVGVAAEEGRVTGCVVVAVGVDLEIVVEGVTQAMVHGVRHTAGTASAGKTITWVKNCFAGLICNGCTCRIKHVQRQ